MESPIENDAAAAAHLALEEELAANLPLYIDIGKVVMSLWDKIVVLDAGALALSISAVSVFRGRPLVGDGGVGYLFAAWKCFLASIGLAVVAQFALTQHMALSQAWLVSSIMYKKLKAAGRIHKPGVELSSVIGDYDSRNQRLNVMSEKANQSALAAGVACLAAALVGLFWLYRFAHANLALSR